MIRICILGSLNESLEDIEMVANAFVKNNIFEEYVDVDCRIPSKVSKNSGIGLRSIISNWYKIIDGADIVIAVKKRDGSIGDGTEYMLSYAKHVGKNIIATIDPLEVKSIDGMVLAIIGAALNSYLEEGRTKEKDELWGDKLYDHYAD